MKYIIALITVVFFLFGCQEKEIKQVVYEGTAKQAILDNMLSRRAIRQYTAQQVSREQLDTIMKSAIFAPSGLNKQPWEIRVLQNPDILKEVNQRFLNFAKGKEFQGSAARYREAGFSIFHDAPTLIVIATDKSNPGAKLDAGIALQNILLSAHAIGLGTCPLGTLVGTMNLPENADILKLLNIPEGYEVTINVALGYPAETPDAPIRYTEKVKIIE
ncbi:nitroreductase [Sphingobacterium oryzagri]|uniref:Nitroreductase n=1 Tax=Sphingobacterium oryzagri TaxID=3025669 RepID=A0ABY7WNN4_9SPHI|nr:nitroreductase [Sphingobacterium sp. KACC 22765]WDF70018.1 nitroreductase [Sphingobacterium sp. KACC 22765]